MEARSAIAAALERKDLNEAQVEAVFNQIMAGEVTPAQIGGLLVALRMKGETVDELVGAARAMRKHARRLTIRSPLIVDTCGTGGDGAGTFNISTTAALIAAGAGLTVAKHGNRAMSSLVGGADVLELLGVPVDLDPHGVAACIDEVGIGFMFAQVFHPAMKHAAGPRRELGVRTVFNLLGPLCNPAGAKRQVIGLFSADWLLPMANALQRLGSEHALVVHGADGVDEISMTGPTYIAEMRDGSVREYQVSPADFGLAPCNLDDLVVASGEASAQCIRDILAGAQGPKADVAVLNAAAALYVGGIADSIASGVQAARESIRSGEAAAKLTRWSEVASR